MRFNKISAAFALSSAVILASACASNSATKSSTCSAYDTTRQSTEYSVRLIGPKHFVTTERYDEAGDSPESFELQIQAIHPKTMASQIEKITLNNGFSPKFQMIDDNCICGMEVRNVKVDCTHITTYTAEIPRKTLDALMNNGLAMTFHLKNGHLVAGPKISAASVKEVLLKSN